TVASRSGNTLHLHNTEVVLPPGSPFAPPGASNIVVEFANDVTVMVSDSTLLSTDRQPELQTNLQSISIGQQVDLEGGYALDSSGNITMDATTGLLRLNPTPAWGTVSSATPGSATVNLLTLGDAIPAALTFTGTGAAGGADADPTAYVMNTGSVDLS